MALNIVDTDDTDGIDLPQGTNLTILQGVVVSNDADGGDAITISTNTYNDGFVSILGTLVSDADGIEGFTGGANGTLGNGNINGSTFYVGETGSIVSGEKGINLEDGNVASPVINYGQILAGSEAVKIQGGAPGNAFFSVSNHGVMSSNSDNAVIQIDLRNDGTITNTGLITNTGTGAGIVISDFEVTLKLVNSGTISALNGFAVEATVFGSTSGFRPLNIFNSGEMFGGILTAAEDDVVKNSGFISDDITLGDGDDTYRGSGNGVVEGTVFGGEGDDTLVGSDADDRFDGGLRSDRIVGGKGDDELNGGGTGDTVLGGDGNDTVNGDGGVDDVRGGNGADVVDGGSGDDIVRGGSGDDRVEGGTGEDDVRGGAGDDEILGGRDKDQLFGGSGNDIFIFENETDSPNDSNRDFIKDFELGADLIDLTGLPGSYDFVGDAAFSGTGREVRVTTNSSGNTTVFADTDGDGTGDFRVVIEGVTGLTESDFLL